MSEATTAGRPSAAGMYDYLLGGTVRWHTDLATYR